MWLWTCRKLLIENKKKTNLLQMQHELKLSIKKHIMGGTSLFLINYLLNSSLYNHLYYILVVNFFFCL